MCEWNHAMNSHIKFLDYECVYLSQVEFYISQSQAANHAVREAACICIAELGTKVV